MPFLQQEAFQLTTSQGGRQSLTIPDAFADAFQLTTSQGGRRMRQQVSLNYIAISTHDLARRSTSWTGIHAKYRRYFNSRPRKEVDRKGDICCRCNWQFQLTTSQGGRLPFETSKRILGVFQLTTSQGGRQHLAVCISMDKNHFNSRPRKEVDRIRATL